MIQDKILALLKSRELKDFKIQCSKKSLPQDEASLENLVQVLEEISHYQFMERAKKIFSKMESQFGKDKKQSGKIEKQPSQSEDQSSKKHLAPILTQDRFDLLLKYSNEIRWLTQSISLLGKMNSFSADHLSILIENRKKLNEVNYYFINKLEDSISATLDYLFEEDSVVINCVDLEKLFKLTDKEEHFSLVSRAFSRLAYNKPSLLIGNYKLFLDAPLSQAMDVAKLIGTTEFPLTQLIVTAIQKKMPYLSSLVLVIEMLSKKRKYAVAIEEPGLVEYLIENAEHCVHLLEIIPNMKFKPVLWPGDLAKSLSAALEKFLHAKNAEAVINTAEKESKQSEELTPPTSSSAVTTSTSSQSSLSSAPAIQNEQLALASTPSLAGIFSNSDFNPVTSTVSTPGQPGSPVYQK